MTAVTRKHALAATHIGVAIAAFAVASVLSLFALLSLGLRRAVEWRMAQPQ